MTIFVQEMSSTVVSAVNRGTFTLADWTVLPKKGVFKDFLDSHPNAPRLAQPPVRAVSGAPRRLKRGFELQNRTTRRRRPPPSRPSPTRPSGRRSWRSWSWPTRSTIWRASSPRPSRASAQDLKAEAPKRYSYEDWVYFTKLIRFSKRSKEEVELIEEEEGLVQWDWIGEDSPMLADITEPRVGARPAVREPEPVHAGSRRAERWDPPSLLTPGGRPSSRLTADTQNGHHHGPRHLAQPETIYEEHHSGVQYGGPSSASSSRVGSRSPTAEEQEGGGCPSGERKYGWPAAPSRRGGEGRGARKGKRSVAAWSGRDERSLPAGSAESD